MMTVLPLQVSHNAYRPDRRDKSLLWTPLIASEGREEEEPGEQEGVATSEESEDEVDQSISAWKYTIQQPKQEEEVAAEMRTLDSDLDRLHDPHLVKSYTRLETAPFLHFTQPGLLGGGATAAAGGGDKWHDWVSLQKDWMNKVEENPENYFDDFL